MNIEVVPKRTDGTFYDKLLYKNEEMFIVFTVCDFLLNLAEGTVLFILTVLKVKLM